MKLSVLAFMIFWSIQAFAQYGNSEEYYVNALIKRKQTEKLYITNETYGLMEKLLRLEIKNNYGDSLRLDMIPGNFEVTINGSDTTYYQMAPLKQNNSLFIWIEKDKIQKWTLFSHYESDIQEHTQFKFRRENGFNFFIAPTFCLLGRTDWQDWQRINIDPSDENDYLQIYRWCNRTHQNKSCAYFSTNSVSFPEIKELQTQMVKAVTGSRNPRQNQDIVDSFQTLVEKKISETIERQGYGITLTVSDLMFNDLDNDAQEEVFWFSVSNSELIDFRLYHLTRNGLIERASESYVGYLKNTGEFKKTCELSELTLYQSKPIEKE